MKFSFTTARPSPSTESVYHPSISASSVVVSSKPPPRKHAAPTSSGYYATQQNAQRKRVRRQAAGALVTGLLGQGQPQSQPKLTPSGKKSTAQPRPAVMIPPKGIGPIMEPNDNDVLCGRGGRINAHIGNVRFREMVVQHKPEYLSPQTKKLEKAHIASEVVREIRSKEPPGRFLKEESNGAWYDIGDAKAIKKVGQALREDAPVIRHEVHSDEEQSCKPPSTTSKTKASVALPQKAVRQQQQQHYQQHYPGSATTSSRSQGGGSDNASSNFEPIAYQPNTDHTNNMGPPVAGFNNQYSNTRRNNAISGAAAALMEQDVPMDPPQDVAFGRSFHASGTDEPSVISGLTNTMVSGMSRTSEVTDDAVRSNLSGRRPQHPQVRGVTHQNFQSLRAQQLQQLRSAWEATSSDRTLQGSDLMAKASMPAASPSRSNFQRSSSWQDGASFADNMSWAEHSLAGGGIHENNSVLSGRSMHSHQMRNDSDSLVEQFMQSSLASRRSQQRPYAQNLYQRSPVPPSAAPIPSSGTSVASMSINSTGLASLGSIKSIMSDLSENLVALDLAEPRMMEDL